MTKQEKMILEQFKMSPNPTAKEIKEFMEIQKLRNEVTNLRNRFLSYVIPFVIGGLAVAASILSCVKSYNEEAKAVIDLEKKQQEFASADEELRSVQKKLIVANEALTLTGVKLKENENSINLSSANSQQKAELLKENTSAQDIVQGAQNEINDTSTVSSIKLNVRQRSLIALPGLGSNYALYVGDVKEQKIKQCAIVTIAPDLIGKHGLLYSTLSTRPDFRLIRLEENIAEGASFNATFGKTSYKIEFLRFDQHLSPFQYDSANIVISKL